MFDDEITMTLQDKNGNDVEISIPETPQPQVIMEFSTIDTTHLEKTENNSDNQNQKK